MSPEQPRIAITTGEPAGIGPDICLMLARFALTEGWASRMALLGDLNLLQMRAEQLNMNVPLSTDPSSQTAVYVQHHPVVSPVIAGQLNVRNASYVLGLLDAACHGCLAGEFAAMVTAPIQKSVICDAGFKGFQGHTEYLADKTGTPRVVMMLAGEHMRVALATTHLALADVPAAIQPDSLALTLRILLKSLQQDFGCTQPHVLVTGLNPHAGEDGHLGREEIDVITPVLVRLRAEGHRLSGPLPADTLFQPHLLNDADAVLAMYHDQGLPVLKYASFGEAVNITLGLPIIRTSVDHGTALSLAGTGRASPSSLQHAWKVAMQMADNRRRQEERKQQGRTA